jgi:hypothetical protein
VGALLTAVLAQQTQRHVVGAGDMDRSGSVTKKPSALQP